MITNSHMKWVMREDPSFKPFLTGLMSVEKGIIVAFKELTRDNVAYFLWRDPTDGRFHTIANLYENFQEMSTMNVLMDKRIEDKQNDIAFERNTISLHGVWLLNSDLSFSKHGSSYREYPEDILQRLATLRASRKSFLATAAMSEAALVKIIEDNNIVRGDHAKV